MERTLSLLVAYSRAIKVAERYARVTDTTSNPDRIRNRASARMHRAYQRAHNLRCAHARAWRVSARDWAVAL